MAVLSAKVYMEVLGFEVLLFILGLDLIKLIKKVQEYRNDLVNSVPVKLSGITDLHHDTYPHKIKECEN
uniref:Uncharacterized protein n=1 Tax=Rhodnius prolixus TaxID=13249 RepID=T1I359_RHOPR